MTGLSGIVSQSALTLLVVGGALSAATLPLDLSTYRDFRLGSNLAAVAKQVSASPSEATVVHRHPALIQEFTWRPQQFGPSSQTESVQDVVLSFYNGELFQIAVKYDRYKTEGMTADDFIDAISATYGAADKLAIPSDPTQGQYGNHDEIVARWQDSQYSYDLIQSSYGPSFKLIGVLRRLEATAQTAIREGVRLDDQEAPKKEAARITDETEAERVRLEKARLVSKANFHQ